MFRRTKRYSPLRSVDARARAQLKPSSEQHGVASTVPVAIRISASTLTVDVVECAGELALVAFVILT